MGCCVRSVDSGRNPLSNRNSRSRLPGDGSSNLFRAWWMPIIAQRRIRGCLAQTKFRASRCSKYGRLDCLRRSCESLPRLRGPALDAQSHRILVARTRMAGNRNRIPWQHPVRGIRFGLPRWTTGVGVRCLQRLSAPRRRTSMKARRRWCRNHPSRSPRAPTHTDLRNSPGISRRGKLVPGMIGTNPSKIQPLSRSMQRKRKALQLMKIVFFQ
mmetsp:Transcript_2317/g.6217  ORF Transcript_2317/g.6217 Transcript_2317/m.6217 type:complete len:213 (+) Transcript_2317:2683-3321(+)